MVVNMCDREHLFTLTSIETTHEPHPSHYILRFSFFAQQSNTTKMNRFLFFTVLVVLVVQLSAQQSAVCTLCTGLIAFAEPYARTPISMAENDLQVLMHAYCNYQPGMQTLCKDLVDRFMHFIYGAFQQSTPPLPHALCLEIRACSS